jgi:hypothetical protein
MISLRLRAGMPRAVATAVAFGISALFYSCDRLTPLPQVAPTARALAPTSEELYVFPYGRLSMTAYEILRRDFPGLRAEELARLALTAQWVQSRLLPGKSATPAESTRCVRALFQPTVSAAETAAATKFAADRFGFNSLDLLRQSLRDASSSWVVDWNPSVAHEYGIPITKP